MTDYLSDASPGFVFWNPVTQTIDVLPYPDPPGTGTWTLRFGPEGPYWHNEGGGVQGEKPAGPDTPLNEGQS